MAFINLLLLGILAVCFITDIKKRKIYNIVTFPSLIVSLVWHTATGGWDGLLFSLSGCFIGFGILLIPYLLGGMGAGDVKLMAVIGAAKGTVFVLTTAVYMGILGGILAIGVILFRKGMWQQAKAIMYSLCGFRYGLKIPVYIDSQHVKQTYPYGVAIVGGALVTLMGKGWLPL